MKPETLLMAAIFGEGSTGPNDDDYYESVSGRSLRDVLMSLLDKIAEQSSHNAPKFSLRVKPLFLARYGFNGPRKTYKELGEIFDVTRERTRQVEYRGLRMLRHPSRSRELKAYLKQTVDVY